MPLVEARGPLERFQPVLRYDSNEAFFADDAREWTDNPGNELRRAPTNGEQGALLAAARPQAGTAQLSLEFLAGTGERYGSGEPVEPGDLITNPHRNYREQYLALRKEKPQYADRIYGRARTDSEGRLWLQYWFYYFFNDYNLAGGIGLHEGDWETIQLRLRDDGEPEIAVYAQHRWSELAPWDDVERPEAEPDRPVVYVARGSHASYFRRGYHETEAWYDICDGKHLPDSVSLEVVGAEDEEPSWVRWPGRWGDTRPRFAGVDQPSPKGPCEHEQWQDPAELLKKSRAIRTAPLRPAPRVEVKRAEDRLRVDYDFGGYEPQPEKLLVTVNAVGDGLPPETYTFGVEKALRGTIETRPRLDPMRQLEIATSVTDHEGRPSGSRSLTLPPVGAGGLGGIWPLVALARLVAWVRRHLTRA